MKYKTNPKPYIVYIIVFIFLNYSVYLLFNTDTTAQITDFVGYEDGIVEYITFFSFLFASFFFVRSYLIKKNIFFLLLAIILFIGAGEEISWGQRIFKFSTPNSLNKVNLQHEFNIHNIGIFSPYDVNSGGEKEGLLKLLNIAFLFQLFWLFYCIILPFIVNINNKIAFFVKKIRLPVPPFSIGIFFFISWIIYKIIVKYIFVPDQIEVYYYTAREMEESIAAFIFLVLSIYFYNTTKNTIKI